MTVWVPVAPVRATKTPKEPGQWRSPPESDLSSSFVSSLSFLDVAGLPATVDGFFLRVVEAQDREVPASRNRAEPVGLLTCWCGRAEIEYRRSVSFLRRLVAGAERRKWLAVGKTRRVLCLVECHRPEIRGRDVGW